LFCRKVKLSNKLLVYHSKEKKERKKARKVNLKVAICHAGKANLLGVGSKDRVSAEIALYD